MNFVGDDHVERSRDWFRQAERDLEHARHSVTAEDHEWACFACQQAAEKALKALYQALAGEGWGHSVLALVEGLAGKLIVSEDLRRAAETGYSRYPVYRDRIDNVVGFLHVKDLVTRSNGKDLAQLKVSELMRTPVVYVPETQSASSVLASMRTGHKHHIAIVIDEFGGMAGIITLEDIIERIVGDIRDEHDDPEKAPPIVELGDGRLLVDARVTMAGLSRHLGAELPEGGDYYSLGGFIVEQLGQVPRPGAVLNKLGFEFIVREADERHITQVEVIPGSDVAPRTSSRPSRPRPAA